MPAVNQESKLAKFTDDRATGTVAWFIRHDVMVVKILSAFAWHTHPDTDDVSSC